VAVTGAVSAPSSALRRKVEEELPAHFTLLLSPLGCAPSRQNLSLFTFWLLYHRHLYVLIFNPE
jgi:hypothetical protein